MSYNLGNNASFYVQLFRIDGTSAMRKYSSKERFIEDYPKAIKNLKRHNAELINTNPQFLVKKVVAYKQSNQCQQKIMEEKII